MYNAFRLALMLLVVAGTNFAGPYMDMVLSDGPVGYWNLDDGGGTATDLTGGNDGTLFGGVTTGQPGALVNEPSLAMGFNGSNGKIDVPWAPELNSVPFTAEVWARSADAGSYRSPLTSRADAPQRGYIFYENPSNRWQAWTGPGWQQQTGPAVVPDEWTHLAMTYDGTEKRFYVDGMQVAAGNVTINPNNVAPLRIGAGATEGPGSFFFSGVIDEVAVYDHVLTAEQLGAHRRLGAVTTPEPQNQLFLAEFNNASSTALGTDASAMVPGGRTGTLPGPTNPDGALVMGGGGTGSYVFDAPLSPYDIRTDTTVSTQAWITNGAPGGQANAYMGLTALHMHGTAASGADERGGLFAQFQPYTTGSGHMRLGFQSDDFAGSDSSYWVDNAVSQPVSGIPNANGLFDMDLTFGGLEDSDPLTFTVSQGAWSSSINTTIGGYRAGLPAAARAAFDLNLADFRNDPQQMNVGIISTSSRVDAYNFLSVTGTGFPPPGSYAAMVLADNPTAYWDLDDTGGTAYDLTGGNNGTLFGGVTTGQPGALVNEPGNAAMSFNGSDGKIDVPWAAELNSVPFTVELWAQATGGSGHRSPLTSRADYPQRGYIFYEEPGDQWQAWNGQGSGWSSLGGPRAIDNEWVHLAMTYDGTEKRFYVNGMQVAAGNVPFSPNDVAPLRIGAGATEGAGNYWFNGLVDEVAVYDHVLTSEQLGARYRAGAVAEPVGTRQLFLAEFDNASSAGLGLDASAMVPGGRTGSLPARTNPDGALLMGGGGTGSYVFDAPIDLYYIFEEPLTINTQAWISNGAPGSQANAYMGLVALHMHGTADSGPDERGGLWAQFQPYTNGTGHIRLGFQSDDFAGSGSEYWIDNLLDHGVSGIPDANGIFDMELLIGGFSDEDSLIFTVSQGEWQASIDATIGAYRQALGARSVGALQAFDLVLSDLRLAPQLMNVGIISTTARLDMYNFLSVTGFHIPEPGTLVLLGIGAALLRRRRR
jgi:hypothetical protein